MVYGQPFFNGSEYSITGKKIRDKRFQYEQTLKSWTDLEDLFLKLK